MKILLNLFLLIFMAVTAFSQPPSTPEQIEDQEWLKWKPSIDKVGQPDEKDKMNPDHLPRRKPTYSGPSAINPNREQAKRLRPSDDDLGRYSSFLKQPNTGIIRLFADLGCSAKNVVRVDDRCLDSVPLSSYYSFRKKNYAERTLSDIVYKDNSFSTDGLFANAMMVALGDLPLESLSLDTGGIKFLADYEQAARIEDVAAKSQEIEKGITLGRYTFAKYVPAIENYTYAIRVIAYRANLSSGGSDQNYNELDGDRRIDIIGAFRVVRKDRDGSVILLWKELQRKDSPKIKVPKKR